jgi:uncharacterized membrane protein YGL010W
VGIPMIVFSIFGALSWIRVAFFWEGYLSAAMVLFVTVVLFYFKISRRLALAFAVWSAPLLILAHQVFLEPSRKALVTVILFFVVGWIFQGLGHAFEKNRPAFFTQWKHLWRGPLFITYEWVTALGIRV